MTRLKSNKEYAIKLVHPEFGDFYLTYKNTPVYNTPLTYFFSKNLSKVSTWKTLSYLEKEVSEIYKKLDNSIGKIHLSFGELNMNDDVDNLILDNTIFKQKMIISRKKYYFPISDITSKELVENAKEIINNLNTTLIEDSKNITNLLIDSNQMEKSFMKTFGKLGSDIHLYRKNKNFLEKFKDNNYAYLEIVDASYKFRLLKLKTLMNLDK